MTSEATGSGETSTRLFRDYGFGPASAPSHRRIDQAISGWVASTSAAPAVEFGERVLSYAELDRRAALLAQELQLRGVKPGDHVGVFLSRSEHMVVAILAVLKSGAAYVPQDARIAPNGHLEHIVETAEIRHVLTLAEYREKIPETARALDVDVFCSEIAPGEKAMVPPVWRPGPTGAAPAVVIFTSGTTGKPNGVRISHANLANIILNRPGNLGIDSGMRVGQILNIAFDMAVWEIFGALCHGACLVIRGKDIQETAERVDVLIATPSILGSLDAGRCRQVKVAAVAGERCPKAVAETWSEFCRFYNGCGPTEVTIVNTLARYLPGDPLTIGAPLPNNTVYVLGPEQQPLEIGEIGEMWAGGACVTSGYLGNPELTEQRYRPDPFRGEGLMFRTRDLGRWTETGQLEVHGRTDDQVKIRGGFRVELDAVNTALEQAPGCQQAAAMRVDGGVRDGELIAFVAPATVSAEAAKQAVADTLPYYCIPEHVFTVDKLPLTGRGKVDRRALLSMLDEPPEPQLASAPPEPTGPGEPIELPAPLPWWKSLWKRRQLMHYNRLIGLVLLLNVLLAPFAWGDAAAVGVLVLANLTAAALIRQQYVVNFLFWLATSIPVTWPLKLRWSAGKVYHFGGIHAGAAISATFWFAVGTLLEPGVLSALILALLLAMVLTAWPRLRQKHHNLFERVHRFGGWAVLLLVVLQQAVTVAQTGRNPLLDPRSWLIAVVVLSVLLPWLRLRKVPVHLVRPSRHVVLAGFDYGVTPFAGSSTAISVNPLKEWHHFANVPAPGKTGFRLTISRAGDFTGQLIDTLPDKVWVKGIPTAGVGNIDKLFRKVLWVATGSGIGPCLPHLLSGETPAKLVWSTRNPEQTYGTELVQEILAVQPDAVIWDTTEQGKPDLVRLAYQAYLASGAEAVICISNKSTTWQIVEEMEIRGIPAYGAIWDS